MIDDKQLPEGWTQFKLGNVCKILPGYGFPKDLQGGKTGEYPFYKVGDISKNVKAGHKYLENSDNYIDEGVLKKIKAKLF
ncbi:MAG: restriction endonuclease subunit S, partial [Pyrinomonadaceae bacterium]|nr:restriction endonuclease subunit S [Sphingobacteriaceae bacterium]